ncbi:MAG: hypothetical protein CVU61_10085 [Deltaproteobacteria bacterium HGW-Deltaproteobacteria-19]|jgi:hypothetical protein|nr:MAG: hypothetical protein CVU61_10085 [Deltaproteobacteria bacterium HGW-Deltaproteobacteria-19]
MTCKEIEERLSAYLDNALPADERRRIEDHLPSCPSCLKAAEDLRKTVGLVHELEEVEPPPWLSQKIMTRIREEAAPKRGILRTLFFPLHIKVPIQAFAMVLVAVLAFQVYRTGEPERQALDLPLPPARIEEKAAAPEAARKAAEPAPSPERRQEEPKAEQAVRSAPPRSAEPAMSRPHDSEEKGLGFAPPPGRRGSTGPSDRAAPPSVERKADAGPGGYAAPLGSSAVQPPAAEAVRESGGEDLREAGKVRQKAAYESKRKDQSESAVMAAKEEKPDNAAMKKKATVRIPAVDLVLRVQDVTAVAAAAERELRASGAGDVRRRVQQGGILLSANLPSPALPDLIERLRSLGDLQSSGAAADTRNGTTAVRIRIAEK